MSEQPRSLRAESAPASITPGLTPFQPTGPYPQVMLDLPTGAAIPLNDTAYGERITIEGRLLDGAGTPVCDAMIETWQADAGGHYAHPADPRAGAADPGFWGYRRVATDDAGRFRIETVKPGAVPGGGHPAPAAAALATPSVDAGTGEPGSAPHIMMAIYGGGIPYRYVTRMYLAGEPANAADPVLQLVPAERRDTLIAARDGACFTFEIRLQGPGETVFFDV